MSSSFIYTTMLVLCLVLESRQQLKVLSYQILNKGQQIEIPLQQLFQNASVFTINDEKSTKNYDKIFSVKTTKNEPYRTVFSQPLEFTYNNKTIRFNETQYYSSKSLYNQPMKLYLLNNNFLMMIIYKQTCSDEEATPSKNTVKGLNLTANLPLNFTKNKQIICNGMQTHSTIYMDIVYVLCRAKQDNKAKQFFLIKVQLVHNSQSFISNLKYLAYFLVGNKTFSCQEYSLKYFDKIRVDLQIINFSIFMYCKKKLDSTSNPVFYFYDPQGMIFTIEKSHLNDCLINSSYLSQSDNGFLSVKNDKVYEFYTDITNITKPVSYCQPTSIQDISQYIFATSRVYNNIQITYFFLPNTTIIIKSSYRTNYQKLQLNRTGFNFKSYAITQQYLALTICNGFGVTIMLVYEMKNLFPRLIDQRVIVYSGQPCNNFALSSTSNYLEKGYYVFFYNKTTNQMSLMEYKGYIMSIKPIASKFQTININMQKQNTVYPYVKKYYDNQVPCTSAMYAIWIQSNSGDVIEQIKLEITIRQFNNSKIQLLPYKKLNIDTPYINFNLSALAIGPLQKFYFQTEFSEKNIQFQFVNYYNQIDISFLTKVVDQRRSVRAVEKLKQMAINIELKVINPVLTLFYNSFVQNCILLYEQTQFKVNCSAQNVIRYKNITQQSRIIVLNKDRWIQYNKNVLQYCTIVGQFVQCSQLPFDFKSQMLKRVKLVKFQLKSNSLPYIELFILFPKQLHYVIFSSKNLTIKCTNLFKITKNEVLELLEVGVQLTNIHFDKNYNHYLLLHLSNTTSQTIKSFALLYDRPAKNDNENFLGHLIKKFSDQKIESIMTIDNFLVIINRQNGTAYIDEYKISQIYSVYSTRSYPLYGRKIVEGGAHTADLQFVYIQVYIQKGERAGKTQYLVYCPFQKSTNILTHVIPKQSIISIVQQIGSTKNKYPHSIGINGNKLFALSIPNLVIKFNYDAKHHPLQYENQKTGLVEYKSNLEEDNILKSVIPGRLQLKLVDYQNVLYLISYDYQFDISSQTIKYKQEQQVLGISQNKTESSYVLKIDKIQGPVMNIELKMIEQCQFVNKNHKFQDIITQSQCLIEIDSQKYGQILDLKSLHLYSTNNTSVQIIITTQLLICVQNHIIIKNYSISFKACAITSYNNTLGVGLFVCDDGQGSVINMFSFYNKIKSCYNLQIKLNIAKPSWLVYQYFKMKFSNPYAIFEVPIRVQENKIYLLTKFNLTEGKFEDKYQSFIKNDSNQIDHFMTKDFQVDKNYGYLLEDGLGIYDLDNYQLINETNNILPLVWIKTKNITQLLGIQAQLVYIKPDLEVNYNEDAYKCKTIFNSFSYIEIGTKTHAYKMKVCFNDDDDYKIRRSQPYTRQQYQIIPVIKFIQYKDCKNSLVSKSKTWTKNNITIKLCVLEIQQHRIFSNYMPITPKTSQYYMQFYSFNPNGTTMQNIYPFRMQKVSTNDQIQINKSDGELIVRSLFNFLCYYKLSSQIKWTLIWNQSYVHSSDKSKSKCSVNLIFKNENFIKQHSIFIQNIGIQKYEGYKPWIFRTFFIVLCLISLVKYRAFIKQKNVKLNKMTYNLLSNQFEVQVRVNSKKQLQNFYRQEQQMQSNGYRQFESHV